jgi:hypothetical protein
MHGLMTWQRTLAGQHRLPAPSVAAASALPGWLQDAPLLIDRNVGPVPPEIMIGCFVVAGLIVSIVYSIDWTSVF